VLLQCLSRVYVASCIGCLQSSVFINVKLNFLYKTTKKIINKINFLCFWQ